MPFADHNPEALLGVVCSVHGKQGTTRLPAECPFPRCSGVAKRDFSRLSTNRGKRDVSKIKLQWAGAGWVSLQFPCSFCSAALKVEVKNEDFDRWFYGDAAPHAFPYLDMAECWTLITRACLKCSGWEEGE